MRRLLDAEVLEDRHARRRRDAARDGAHSPPRDTPAIAHDSCDRHRSRDGRRSSSRPLACSASQSPSTSASSTRTPSSAARHQASVPGRTCRWMSASSAVSVRRGSITISDAVGIVGDLLQHRAGAREAVRLPRVLAHEHRDLGVLVVAGRVAARPAEELTVDPELAGLLLRERVRRVDDAERARGRAAVAAAEVVALPAAAVIEDRLAAVRVADRRRGAAATSAIAVSQSISSNVPSARRRSGRRQPVAAVLVVVEAQRLLARVALRRRVGLVAADPLDAAGRRGAPRCRS